FEHVLAANVIALDQTCRELARERLEARRERLRLLARTRVVLQAGVVRAVEHERAAVAERELDVAARESARLLARRQERHALDRHSALLVEHLGAGRAAGRTASGHAAPEWER